MTGGDVLETFYEGITGIKRGQGNLSAGSIEAIGKKNVE